MGLTAIHAFILCQMLFAMMIECTLEYTKNKTQPVDSLSIKLEADAARKSNPVIAADDVRKSLRGAVLPIIGGVPENCEDEGIDDDDAQDENEEEGEEEDEGEDDYDDDDEEEDDDCDDVFSR
ncbi:hypothetical protein M8J77_016903 [Diaphorina citri]|nr:hypothetical protein M8J77_016903 [Diaphorina citri]